MGDDRRYRIVLYADDNEKRTKGLMFTDPLPDDECALFVFDRERDHVFWNRNVGYPLHLAFVGGDGTVLAVRSMDAMSEQPCSSGSANVKYVVETALGSLDGLHRGDRMIVDPMNMSVRFASIADGDRHHAGDIEPSA